MARGALSVQELAREESWPRSYLEEACDGLRAVQRVVQRRLAAHRLLEPVLSRPAAELEEAAVRAWDSRHAQACGCNDQVAGFATARRARASRRRHVPGVHDVQERAADAEAELRLLAELGRHPAPQLLEQQRAALGSAAERLQPTGKAALGLPAADLAPALLAAWSGRPQEWAAQAALEAEDALLVGRGGWA